MDQTFDSQGLGRRVNEMLILSELDRGAMHGYQIAIALEERSDGFFPFSHGTLYPILHRLEKDGLIEGGWSDPAEGRPRKEYTLTDGGRGHLDELVAGWRDLRERLEAIITTGGKDDETIRTGAA